MAFFDNLKKKYTELLNPVKKSLSDDSGWFRQGNFTPVKQVQSIANNFNPTSNAGNNFWSSPVATKLANIQRVTQPLVRQAGQRIGQGFLSMGNLNAYTNPVLSKQLPTNYKPFEDFKKTTSGVLTAYGLTNPALAATSTLVGGGLSSGIKALENIKQGQPISQGTGQAFTQGGGQALANAGITRLTSGLVSVLSNKIPALEKLTDTALAQGLPASNEPVKQAITKWADVAGKKLFRNAIVETAVETPIWAYLNQQEKESFIDAVKREAVENMAMNVAMSGFSSTMDLTPIVSKAVKDSTTKLTDNYIRYASSPEGLRAQAGSVQLPKTKTGGGVVSPNVNKSVLPDTKTSQDVNIPPQKKPIKIKPATLPESSPVSTQPSVSQSPYIDSKGELQFPGFETKYNFSKTDLDTSIAGQGKGSIMGGDGMPASPEIKQSFATWVNSRRASQLEGIIKGREFKDLDSKGVEGIFEFQTGTKGGRFGDIKTYFDDKFALLKEKGVPINYKQDYLPQMWKNPPDQVEQVFGNRLGLKPSFTMESIIENYKQGIEAGLTPKYTKLSDLVASYEARANKALADRTFFEEIRKANVILPEGKAPIGWVTLDPDRFPKLSFTTDEGKYSGVYKAPEDLAKMINNYLADPSTSPNVVLKGLNTIANWTSSVKNRVLSFGVPGTAVNAHGFNILARNIMASKNPIEGAVTGIKYMLHPELAAKYLDSELIKAPDAVKHGLTLSANEFKSVLEEPQGFKTKFGDIWDKLFEKGLFDRMLPALKLQKYQEVVDGFIKSGMDETLAKRNAAKFTNDVFGGINWEEFGKSRDWQNIKRIFILAPDWLETNINLAKKTAKSTVNFSDKSLSAYRRFLATFLGSYVTMNVVNKLSSGHWMYQNDSGNTFNIEAGYTSDGQKRYIRPFGTAADFIRIPYDVANSLSQGDLQAPARVVRNRLSIPAGVGLGLFLDTDYTGKPIGWKGKDKYGQEMPTGQRIMGVGGEVATLLGFPAFAKQGLDYASGKTGLEPALLPALELPFRYSGGANNKTQQKITEILQSQGVGGQALYEANESIRGLTFSDKEIESIRQGGIETFNKLVSSKQTSAKLSSELKGTGYYKSEDAPKNVVSKVVTYGKAVITDPQATLDAVVAGNPVRKVENGFVVLERREGLGQIDLGDKNTQVDHIVPLEFGGKNPKKNANEILSETKGMTPEQKRAYLSDHNLEVLTVEQHKIKTTVQNELSKKLSRGEITKQDARRMLENWKSQLSMLTPTVKQALATDVSVGEQAYSGKTYTITNPDTGKPTDYDITSPILRPDKTGFTEVDKLNTSKYNSAITTRINQIKKVMDDGQITPAEAEKLIGEIKTKKISLSKAKKPKKITFKAPKVLKLKAPKITQIKIKSPKIKRVKAYKRPKIRKLKVKRIKLKKFKA